MPDPTMIVSDPENSYFSVSFKNIEAGQYLVTVPQGHYTRALSFIAPNATPPDSAYLNLFCKHPNEAAPIEAGYQLLNRFDMDFIGDAWRCHDLDLIVDSGGRQLVLQVGSVGSYSCVYLLKLIGFS